MSVDPSQFDICDRFAENGCYPTDESHLESWTWQQCAHLLTECNHAALAADPDTEVESLAEILFVSLDLAQAHQIEEQIYEVPYEVSDHAALLRAVTDLNHNWRQQRDLMRLDMVITLAWAMLVQRVPDPLARVHQRMHQNHPLRLPIRRGYLKKAYISDHRNGQLMYKDGKPRTMPVFRWFYLYADEHGWRFNIMAFVRGATDNFRHFSMQGVIVVAVLQGARSSSSSAPTLTLLFPLAQESDAESPRPYSLTTRLAQHCHAWEAGLPFSTRIASTRI